MAVTLEMMRKAKALSTGPSELIPVEGISESAIRRSTRMNPDATDVVMSSVMRKKLGNPARLAGLPVVTFDEWRKREAEAWL